METNGETNSDFFTENPIFLSENEFPFPENEFPFNEESERPPEVSESVPEMSGENAVSEEAEEAMEEIAVKEELSEEPEPEEENQFSVEAIEGKRRRLGKQEYLVKWLGFSHEENTWEPVDNLNCQELIADFESKQTPSKRGRKPKAETTPTAKTTPTTAKKDGFSRGLKAKKVVSVTREESEELFYSIEFQGSKQVELIASRVARVKCPQLLIQFLQSKLVFNRKRPREPLENYRPIQSKKFSLFSQPITD